MRRFERGHCSAPDFAAGVVTDWDLPVTGDDFLARFREWPDGLYEGALGLVERSASRPGGVPQQHQLPALGCHGAMGTGGAFDHTFLSYRMGLVKPDQAVFDHVIGELGVPAGEVVFLDDNALNVDRAASLGFDSRAGPGCRSGRPRPGGAGIQL